MTPERFFTAIEGSATFDLHRTPLVLAMSVGLYLERRIDAVPNSISALYKNMIRTMLDRHKFAPDGPPVNAFTRDDKETFLQRFSLTMAERPDAFQDFSVEELLAEAERLGPSLRKVRPEQAQAFVDEIVKRSGLLTRITAKTYTFAHRSIQEYLIAAQLRDREPNGVDLLLARAADRDWHQVVIFFAAGDTSIVEDFVTRLYARDRELAIRCLANVETQNINTLAERMLTEFTDDTLAAPDFDAIVSTRLAAVLHACRAVPEPVRDKAIACAGRLLHRIDTANFTLAVGGYDNLLRVLTELVATNATEVASLVPAFAESIPDDPRLVPALWRCLNVLDHEASPEACRKLIARLLVIAMEPTCFTVLEEQPRMRSGVVTRALVQKAYPFENALSLDESNLVTLLAWAEMLEVMPGRRNLFLEAKVAGPQFFTNLERDNRRTIRVSWRLLHAVLSALVPTVAMANTIWIATTRPQSFLDPYGWWNVLLFATPVTLGTLLAYLCTWVPSDPEVTDNLGHSGHWLERIISKLPGSLDAPLWIIAAGVLIPGAISLSLCDLLQHSTKNFLIVATGGVLFGYLFFFTDAFRDGIVWTLNKRNKFVDAYTDPASAHWLRRRTAEPVQAESGRPPQ